MNDLTRKLIVFIGWLFGRVGAFIVAAIVGAWVGRHDRDNKETTR